jgi:hypothetical protein
MESGEGSIEELHSLPNIVSVINSRRLRWAGHVVIMEECRSAFKILAGKRTVKRTLGRPKRGWGDNIRIDLIGIGINRRKRVDSAHNRKYWRTFVNAALNLGFHKS